MDSPELVKIMDRLSDSLSPIPEKFVEVLNKLPRIVVIGEQSAGKSSVLERFVGRDLLPRGESLVTRCPLELRLNHCPPNDPRRIEPDGTIIHEDWAIFAHHPDKWYTDFQEICAEIQRTMQNRDDCRNYRISDQPIGLEIFSKDAVTLSLIDLPGITRVPVGDQPENIEEMVINMMKRYIGNPNTIILAVVEANVDITHSFVINMAYNIDPRGDRTVIVLTKLDAMLHGTDARKIFEGRHGLKNVPKNSRIIGLVNRSPAETQGGKSMEACKLDEQKFFAKNYPHYADKHGIEHLKVCLHEMMMDKIQTCVPELKADIHRELERHQALLAKLDEPLRDKGHAMCRFIKQFNDEYNALLEGTVPKKPRETKHHELIGGAEIAHIFGNTYAMAMERLNGTDGLDLDTVHNMVLNAQGCRPVLYLPENVFGPVVSEQIRCMEEPSIECVKNVHQVMLNLIHRAIPEEVANRFTILQAKLTEVVTCALGHQMEPTKKIVQKLIAIQRAHVNTQHPQFQAQLDYIIKGPSSKASVSISPYHGHGQNSNTTTTTSSSSSSSATNGQPKLFFWPKIVTMAKKYSAKKERTGKRVNGSFDNGNGQLTNDNGQLANGNGQLANGNGQLANGNGQLANDNGNMEMNGHGEAMLTIMPIEKVMPMGEIQIAQCELLVRAVECYFNIVRVNVQDLVPKAIIESLVNHIRDNLRLVLDSELLLSPNMEQFLEESKSVAAKREETRLAVEALKKADKVISEVHNS